jgi:hypothetical protein
VFARTSSRRIGVAYPPVEFVDPEDACRRFSGSATFRVDAKTGDVNAENDQIQEQQLCAEYRSRQIWQNDEVFCPQLFVRVARSRSSKVGIRRKVATGENCVGVVDVGQFAETGWRKRNPEDQIAYGSRRRRFPRRDCSRVVWRHDVLVVVGDQGAPLVTVSHGDKSSTCSDRGQQWQQ